MNELDKLITSIGALAEWMGVFRNALIDNGFTREEAVGLCAEILANQLHRNED